MGTTEANFKKAKVTQVPMKCSIDVAYSHFSEVPVPMRDVGSGCCGRRLHRHIGAMDVGAVKAPTIQRSE